MIVSIHQPAYLPWLGYLDRIKRSDLFIFLDTVQFEKNSFTNRNKIKTKMGPVWLTIPVKASGHFDRTVADIEMDGAAWRAKHVRTLEQSYARAPFFAERFERLRPSYEAPVDRLADFCHHQLRFWLTEFGIGTSVVKASRLDVVGRKSELVLSLCTQVGATTYLSGPMGRNYLDERAFQAAGIAVCYHAFEPVAYPQLFGEFVSGLAGLDCWLNCANPTSFGEKG